MKLMELHEAMKVRDDYTSGIFVGAEVSPDSKLKLKDVINELNIDNPIDMRELHCTIMYTYDDPPNGLLNEYDNKELIYDKEIKGDIIGLEVFETQDSKKALVLRIDNGYLKERHEYLKSVHGLTYTHDEYKPHVTLTYDAGDVNMEDINIKKYVKKINFSKEYISPLDPDWK